MSSSQEQLSAPLALEMFARAAEEAVNQSESAEETVEHFLRLTQDQDWIESQTGDLNSLSPMVEDSLGQLIRESVLSRLSDGASRENIAILLQATVASGVETSSYPDCVMVFDSYGFHCSGVAVAPRVVATAAHCAYEGGTFTVKIGQNKNNIQESHALQGPPVRHPNYVALPDRSRWNDLALLFLESSVSDWRDVARRSAFSQASFGTMVGYGGNAPNSLNGRGIRRAGRDVPFEAQIRRDTNGRLQRTTSADSTEVILSANHYLVVKGDSGGGLYVGVGSNADLVAGIASRKCGLAEAGISSRGSVYVYLDEHRPLIEGECSNRGVTPPQFVG